MGCALKEAAAIEYRYNMSQLMKKSVKHKP